MNLYKSKVLRLKYILNIPNVNLSMNDLIYIIILEYTNILIY